MGGLTGQQEGEQGVGGLEQVWLLKIIENSFALFAQILRPLETPGRQHIKIT